MKGFSHPQLREVFASAFSRLTSFVLATVIVAVSSATVLLTAGRAEGAQKQVLEALDRAESRVIALSAPPSAGLNSSIVGRLAHIHGISWAGAFGPARDGWADASLRETPVATRAVWSTDLGRLKLPTGTSKVGFASPLAVRQLGLVDTYGSIVLDDDSVLDVRRSGALPEYLESIDPAVLIPMGSSEVAPVTLVLVLAESHSQIAAAERTLLSVASPSSPDEVKLETSGRLATLRSSVEGDLGNYGREIVLGTFTATAILVGCVLLVLAMMRRKDFGRRRALGATRAFIIGLISAQGALSAITGASLGAGGALVALSCSGSPVPSLRFVVAVIALLTVIATAAAVPPAIYAATRDPATELRVP